MASTFSNLLYHIAFSTKERAPLIVEDIEASLYAYMGGILRGEGGILLEIGGMPDHVHLVAKLKPIVAVAEAVKKVKGKSSKWLNEQPGRSARFEWQAGYAAFSVSQSMLERVRAYVRTQKEHHRRVSFKDELISLLERNGVPYDEKYLLG